MSILLYEHNPRLLAASLALAMSRPVIEMRPNNEEKQVVFSLSNDLAEEALMLDMSALNRKEYENNPIINCAPKDFGMTRKIKKKIKQ